MARSLGQSMRILKAETKGMKEDDTDAAPSQPPVQQPQQLPQAQVSPPRVAPPVDQTQVNKNAS
jgi:sec-independent protein translocase protein TatA